MRAIRFCNEIPQERWGVPAYKRRMRMCPLMWLHFHNWNDYNEVALSTKFYEWNLTFSDFWGKKILVSRD